ncbi:MAG: DUF952 domain-containing protein [Ferruginibacter sp.]
MIYHITNQTAWEEALQKGFYITKSLAKEGFIHTSALEQVPGVVDRYYQNEPGLILLHINESKLSSPLKYEMAPSVNEMFPHIFGPINIEAVIKTEML